MFPIDAKDKDGAPFWSGPKRAPTPIPFDPTDELHGQFVTACANLLAFTLGIEQFRNSQAIAQKAASFSVPEFVPKVIKIELPGEENKATEAAPSLAEMGLDDEIVLAELLSQLNVAELGINPKEI